MISLNKVFSSNALFQHSAPLEIKGIAEKCEKISAKLIKDSEIIGEWSGNADDSGRFSVAIETPGPSYDFYDLEIKGADDEKILKNIERF